MENLDRLRRLGFFLLTWFFLYLSISTIVPAGLEIILGKAEKTEFEKSCGLAKWIVNELRTGSLDYKRQVVVLAAVLKQNGINYDQIGTSAVEVLDLIKKNAKLSASKSLEIFRSQDSGREILKEEILFDLKIAELQPEDIGSSKEELAVDDAAPKEKTGPEQHPMPNIPDLGTKNNRKIEI